MSYKHIVLAIAILSTRCHCTIQKIVGLVSVDLSCQCENVSNSGLCEVCLEVHYLSTVNSCGPALII